VITADDETCGTRIADAAKVCATDSLELEEATPAALDDATTTTAEEEEDAAAMEMAGVLSSTLFGRTTDALLELAEEDVVATTTGAVDEAELDTAAALVALPLASVETELAPVGTSPARTHPVFAVKAAGHSTWTKSTVGLSAPSNQS